MSSSVVGKRAVVPVETMTDLMRIRERLGNVPFERVLLQPLPGTATEEDARCLRDRADKLLCELIAGVLVEKAIGTRESLPASGIIRILGAHVDESNLGMVLGAHGMLRLEPGLVRIPDVLFIAWDNVPNGEVPNEAVASLVPDLAVEVLSESNPAAEIDHKIRGLLPGGDKTRLDPRSRNADGQDVRLARRVHQRRQTG